MQILRNGLKKASWLVLLGCCLPMIAFADDASDAVSQVAFQNMLKNYFPMTPTQISAFKEAAAEQERANAEPVKIAPVQSSSQIIPLTLKPGAPQKVIRIGQGMITSVVFTDQNGKVWPIESYSIGDPQSFRVEWDKKSGVMMIQGSKLFAQSNIAVMLKGLDIPVMVNLFVGQKAWDYLDYLRIAALAPGDDQASPQSMASAPGYLINILNGVPPIGAATLPSSNPAVSIWSYPVNGNMVYLVLTQGTLLSPAPKASATGPGERPYHAYEIQAAPLLMISLNGNMVRVEVNGSGSDD